MNRSLKLLLGGIFIAILFLLSGCTTATYYGGYYDPYPHWGYRGRTYVGIGINRPGRPHRPGHGGPGFGRPERPPNRPMPKPTNGPRPRPRPRPSPRRR